MEKKIKIKSTSLTPLNETLQKLKLNDTIKDFTPVIVEADGKFTSIMNAKEEFNPNDLGSAFETEEQSEEQKETKEQLLNKAKDALKQTLTNSEELNTILKKIQDLSKEDSYNTWEVNKENNAASLKSKNAQIFKQNNNLCLSHNGKIELFKSIPELHQWLKDNGYPLPSDNVIIHESVELKEGRNWLDLLNQYNDKKKANVVASVENPNIEQYIDLVTEYDDLIRKHRNLEKESEDLIPTIKRILKQIQPGESIEDALKAGEITQDDFDIWMKHSQVHADTEHIFNTIKSFYDQNNLSEIIPIVNKYRKQQSKLMDRDYQGLSKPISKEILQAANRTKEVIKPNRSLLQKEEEVEECFSGACVTTAALGPAVTYVASPKKKEEESEENKELQEAFASLIPGDSNLIGDKRQLVLKFLTWYKRNAPLIKSGKIQLPKDFEQTFDEIIEPKILSNHSDSMSKIWLRTIEKRLKPVAAKLAQTKNIPEEIILQNLIDKPNEKICNALNAELNSYIPDDEKYISGKVKLIPGESLLATSKDNSNFIQRINWQKAGYQAKLDGVVESEDLVKAYIDLKNFLKNKPEVKSINIPQFTPEQLELIKKYNLNVLPQTESTIFESASKYPWLNKILGTRLVEDDTPADFATGSPISSDMSNDSIDTSSSTTSTSTDSDAPDIDFGSTPTDNTPSFGDINIDTGGYSPDEGNEEVAPVPTAPEYKIIDVLLDDDNNDVKVKVQNQETKETEIKDLEDIDV